MDPLILAALGLIAIAWVLYWLANLTDPDRIADTRERRRWLIEHDRHRPE